MNHMSCEVIRDLLALYAEDALSQETAGAVKEHLDGCESCRKKEARLRQQFALCSLDEESRTCAEYAERIRRKKRTIRGVALGLAAALLTGAIAVGIAGFCRSKSTNWQEFLQGGADRIEAYGGTMKKMEQSTDPDSLSICQMMLSLQVNELNGYFRVFSTENWYNWYGLSAPTSSFYQMYRLISVGEDDVKPFLEAGSLDEQERALLSELCQELYDLAGRLRQKGIGYNDLDGIYTEFNHWWYNRSGTFKGQEGWQWN